MNSRKSKRRALSRQMLNRRLPVELPRPEPPRDRPLTEREQNAVIQHDVDKLRKGKP